MNLFELPLSTVLSIWFLIRICNPKDVIVIDPYNHLYDTRTQLIEVERMLPTKQGFIHQMLRDVLHRQIIKLTKDVSKLQDMRVVAVGYIPKEDKKDAS